MSVPFLQQLAAHIHGKYKDKVDRLCIVLPNRRAALFLKQHLAAAYGRTIWLPDMLSSEEFVERLSGLQVLEEIDLVCHLYSSYKACSGEHAESFESFAKWGQMILQDFNEIDRSLADPAQLYDNLREIRVVENWSLGEPELTASQSRYLAFMASLGAIYRHYTRFLLDNGWAYAGLAARTACERQAQTDIMGTYHAVLFCGFNALTGAEEKLFGRCMDSGRSEMIWDGDRYYIDNEAQEAGHFLRKYLSKFASRSTLFSGEHFLSKKRIEVVSVPKQTGQAQVVRQRLEALMAEGAAPGEIAVVLANEKMLAPLLQQIPPAIGEINVTMGYPLRHTAAFGMIEQLLQVQSAFARQKSGEKVIYHKDLTALLRQPLFLEYLRAACPGVKPAAILRHIAERNIAFITRARFAQLFEDAAPVLSGLIQPAESVTVFAGAVGKVLDTCIRHFASRSGAKERLELEYVYLLLRNLNRIIDIVDRQPESDGYLILDIFAFRQLFIQIAGSQSASFSGEPLTGLQVMGVLETRCLDFRHVILVNANEGILPSGRSANSFIPNDLKNAFGLPLYQEKDAVYAYHFYRLLQRAETVTITCDSETDTFGKGEKSRFVTQLKMEMPAYNSAMRIADSVAVYPDLLSPPAPGIYMKKTAEVVGPVLKKATSAEKYGGLSPSGLNVFKDCSLQFYFRYGARLRETEEVEESAEAGTFGSILHLSLEKLYKTFAGRPLNRRDMEDALKMAGSVVNESFLEFFGGAAPQGKTLLQEEVIRVYVKKLIGGDLRLLEKLSESGETLNILFLEQEFTAPVRVNLSGEACTVYIRGKIDRIDRCGGKVRVIDYKSSVKPADRFTFTGFDDLFGERACNKQLQLMIYAWLLHRNGVAKPEELLPAIIPFKVFLEEPKVISGPDKNPLRFTAAMLNEFEAALAGFIEGIFDPAMDFSPTDDSEICGFCAYKAICNRG
jgi:ATP-dependent helicase/nuclease subunit B